MESHIISLICFIILFAVMMILVGREIERNTIRTISYNCADKEKIQERIDARKKVHDGEYFIFILSATITLVILIASYFDLPNFYIKKFKEGKIIENMSYNYQKINGEKVLKDSTITYVPYKE